MLKLRSALLCARVLTDVQTNLVSYIDVVEQLNLVELPMEFPQLFLAVTLHRGDDDPDEFPCLLRILSPDGRVQRRSGKMVGNFEGGRDLRLNIQLVEFPITSAGTYTFILDAGGIEEFARVECEVTLQEPVTS